MNYDTTFRGAPHIGYAEKNLSRFGQTRVLIRDGDIVDVISVERGNMVELIGQRLSGFKIANTKISWLRRGRYRKRKRPALISCKRITNSQLLRELLVA